MKTAKVFRYKAIYYSNALVSCSISVTSIGSPSSSGSRAGLLQMIDDTLDSSVPDSVSFILGAVFKGLLQFRRSHASGDRAHFGQVDLLQ